VVRFHRGVLPTFVKRLWENSIKKMLLPVRNEHFTDTLLFKSLEFIQWARAFLHRFGHFYMWIG
jgi:hypothetical protein